MLTRISSARFQIGTTRASKYTVAQALESVWQLGLTGQVYCAQEVCAMPNFYEYNPEQGYLLPPSVREALGEKHLCFFIHQAGERLDWKQFEQGYSVEGHPA